MPAVGSLVTVSTIIRAGASLSSAVDLSAGTPRYLITPPDWNYAGGLSLQISVDGTTFFDVFSSSGREFITAAITANAAYPLLGGVLQFAAFVKIRSGSRESPVKQLSDRPFKLVLAVPAAGSMPAVLSEED